MKSEKTQFRVLVLIVFLGFIGISIPYLIFPALFLNPEYSIMPVDASLANRAIVLGFTLAAYPLGQFFGSPILGSFSDDYGRKGTITISLVVAAFCYLVTGLAIHMRYLELLILSRFAAGLMEGNIAVARAMAADFTSMPKASTFGKINASASIAYLIGPFIGGLTSDKNLWSGLSLMTPFYVVCFLFFVLAAVSHFVLNPSVESKSEKATFLMRLNLVKRLNTLFSNRALKFLLIVSTAFTLAVDIFYEFGPVFLTMKWGLGPAELMYYNGILCIALGTGNGWLSTLPSSTRTKRHAILFSIGGFALLLLGMISANTQTLMLALFGISGLLIGMACTIMTVKISDSVSSHVQGEVMGVQLSLRVLGDAMICIFGGALLLLSSHVILIAAALLAFATMAFYARRAAHYHP